MTTASVAGADEIAGALTLLAGTEVTPVPGGFRVKETATHWVDIALQIYNWRVYCTPKRSPMTYDRWWCFSGTGLGTLIQAVLAVAEWDGGDRSEPEGWVKNGQTGEWRAPE